MDNIYIWVKNIAIYAILVNVLTNLIGSANYKKFIRFFTGMVMVIIVISPLTKLFNVDDIINNYIEDFNYKIETRETGINFGNIEDSQNQLIIDKYKSELTNQVIDIINNNGLYAISVDIGIIEDTSSTNYGDVEQINIIASKKDEASKISIDNVKKVIINNKSSNIQEELNSNSEKSETIKEINLKKALWDFYNIPMNNININIQE